MSNMTPTLGQIMKKARLEQRFTQEEIAERIGCHPQYYKNLENIPSQGRLFHEPGRFLSADAFGDDGCHASQTKGICEGKNASAHVPYPLSG